MTILGVDYGRKKIGLAISEGKLAEPLRVVRVKSFFQAIEKVKRVQKELQIEKTIVGVSEGEMGEESKKFANEIGAETFSETLSTHDAQELAREYLSSVPGFIRAEFKIKPLFPGKLGTLPHVVKRIEVEVSAD